MLGDPEAIVAEALDRLEGVGLVERQLDPGNRRVRIPAITPAGSRVQEAITAARRAAEEVPGMTAKEMQTLRKLLARLDHACEAAGMKSTGSCV